MNKTCVRGEMSYRLLKSSFFLVQSMGGALLLERFWCAISLTCCRDMLSAGMVSVTKPWKKKKKKTLKMIKDNLYMIVKCSWDDCWDGPRAVCSQSQARCWTKRWMEKDWLTTLSSSQVLWPPYRSPENTKYSPFNTTVNAEYQDPPQGGGLGLNLSFSCVRFSSDHFRF